MFRIRLASVFIAAALAPLPAARVVFADDVMPSGRVARHVNVRELPSYDAREVGELAVGERATLLNAVPRWRKIRLSTGVEGFVSKAWTVVTPTRLVPAEERLSIRFLNVGAGACAVIECPGADAPVMFYDCGKEDSRVGLSQADGQVLIDEILARRAVPANVVISHPHEDHYNWIPSALENADIQSIWLGGERDRYDAAISGWISDKENDGAQVNGGGELPAEWHNDGDPLGTGLSCGLADSYVLTVNTGGNDNSKSLVLMVEYESFRAVFSGDAHGQTEDSAIRNFGDVSTTVLAGSNHGAESDHSNDEDWAKATSPSIVVYSAGSRHGHPRCVAVNSYRDNVRLFAAPSHNFYCLYSAKEYDPVIHFNPKSELAEYNTGASGTITITTDGHSTVSVSCSDDSGCAQDWPL
ncbi:MAG: SH3 domain-containing protein [Gammaproteobacteria bacterium]|nr:SH3 domain-containing protein [Gammaproteobacteria bacterium]